jgi:hypothetical protein
MYIFFLNQDVSWDTVTDKNDRVITGKIEYFMNTLSVAGIFVLIVWKV